jgi:hypothetical protein
LRFYICNWLFKSDPSDLRVWGVCLSFLVVAFEHPVVLIAHAICLKKKRIKKKAINASLKALRMRTCRTF